MYSTIRKSLITGVLAVALACGYDCKSEMSASEKAQHELELRKVKVGEENNRIEREKLKLKKESLRGGLEKKVSNFPKGQPVSRTEIKANPVPKEVVECYLKAVNFRFCAEIKKRSYKCLGSGTEYDVGGEMKYLFFLDNGPRSTSNIQAQYKVTRGKRTYFRTQKKNLREITKGGRRGFKGTFLTKYSWPAAKYRLTITLKEQKTNCTYQFKKTFELFEKPEDEGGWSPPPGWVPPKVQ